MKRALPILAVLVAGSAPAQQPSAAHADVARVEVHQGRARISHAGQEAMGLSRGDSALTEGAAHLELRPGGRARVSWAGRASLELWGPAAIQWESEAPSGPEDPMRTFPDRGLEVTFFDVSWADFETRRGEHVLRMPGEWRLDCRRGAWQLRGLPTGPLELRHHAGEAATLTWLGDPDRARPPLAVYSGSSIRIDRPAGAPVDRGGRAPWGEDEDQWPWRRESDRPRDRREREELARETTEMPGYPTRDPSADGPRASIRGAVPPGDLRVVVTEDERSGRDPVAPLDGRKAPQRRRPTPPRRPEAPREQPEPRPQDPEAPRPRPERPAPTPEPDAKRPEPAPPAPREPGSPSPAFRSAQWRGLQSDQLTAAGAVGVQRAAGVEVRVFASGRYKVLVDASAAGPVWAFAVDRDYRLHPGAVVVFDPEGGLRLRFGEIEEHEALEGRPRFDRVRR